MSTDRILSVDIEFLKTLDGFYILRDIKFFLKKGETLCIIGESGSGKSMTANCIMGLIPKELNYKGEICYFNREKRITAPEILRGEKITMVFQEPMTALNPLFTIGDQLEEIIPNVDSKKRKGIVIEALKSVGIRDAERVYKAYPHQLSGGMRQRALIAMAFLPDPEILIADEPTTALDVTVASGILSLINRLKKEKGTSLIFISHDINIVEKVATRILVMYGGIIVEEADRDEILNRPLHPYTRALVGLFKRRKERPEGILPELKGYVPSIREMPGGCPFNPRCEIATEICRKEIPPIKIESNEHIVRCFNYLNRP